MDSKKNISEPLDDEEKRQVELVVETHVKILTAAYDKAMAYTNLVIVAGYASLFGLWHLTKEQLSRNQILSAALLLLVSIIIFVLFEVYKAYYTSTALLGYSQIVNSPENQDSLGKLVSEIERYKLADQRRGIRFGKSWLVVFIVTTLTGLGAALILLYAFLRALLAR